MKNFILSNLRRGKNSKIKMINPTLYQNIQSFYMSFKLN